MKSNATHYCQYNNCENTSETHDGRVHKDLDDAWVCEECEDLLNPEGTGFCGVGCKLGYGCDQSC